MIAMRTFAMRLTGLVILLAASGSAYADGDAARGQIKFEECAACHKLVRDENSVGPSLNGVFGRKAAELSDFRYSPALKRSGIAWTSETLNTVLLETRRVVLQHLDAPIANELTRRALDWLRPLIARLAALINGTAENADRQGPQAAIDAIFGR